MGFLFKREDALKFYVYLASIGGDVKYVGKGKGFRYQHINSGISSCYWANKAHFEGSFIDIDFYRYFESEEDALLFEKDLIASIQPPWNIAFNASNPQKKRVSGVRKPVEKQLRATSKYFGVSILTQPVGGKRGSPKYYRAWCRIGSNTKKHIGHYETEIEAAIARDNFIKDNNIPHQLLNFP